MHYREYSFIHPYPLDTDPTTAFIRKSKLTLLLLAAMALDSDNNGQLLF
jgi:hypothetical protein